MNEKLEAAMPWLFVGTLLLVGTLPAQAQTSGNTPQDKTVGAAKPKSATKACVLVAALYCF